MTPPSVSAAQRLIPTSDEPAHLREVVARQGIWIDHQDQTNRSHWSKLCELEDECRDCRGDRRQEIELVQQTLTSIDSRLDVITETLAAKQAAAGVWWQVAGAVGKVVVVLLAAFVGWWLR